MTRREEIKQATPKEKFNNFHKQVAYEFGFEQGAQWADRTMVEKACDWLESNLCHYDENYRGIDSGNSLIEDFKKTMEEKICSKTD